MKRRGVIAAAVVGVMAPSSPALADKFFAVTPSGSPETVFSGKPAAVVGQLSSKCMDAHWTVTSSTSNEVVCEAPMNFGQSVLGQLAMGNSYSTPPRRFFRFNVNEVNGISRVQAAGWMELQMALGQTRRTDFAGPEFHNGMMNFMLQAGGAYPQGTTFPNHVILGVAFADAQAVPGGGMGAPVRLVEPGSPAEHAGIRTGDIITSIAKKRFKNLGQLLDAQAKAAETSTYEVSLLREGKPLHLMADRAMRPPITTTVIAAAVPVQPVLQPAVVQLSPADELMKLATLRDKGVITSEEFESQKKKLLGN